MQEKSTPQEEVSPTSSNLVVRESHVQIIKVKNLKKMFRNENRFDFEEENKYPKYEDWRAKTPQRGSSMLAFVKFCTRLKVMIGFDAILL